jgi:TP901 family phage tail tape measure protein
MARGGAAANVQSAQMQQNLLNTVNATGKFRASIQNISTTTETFTNALEKNKLSMAESFRFAGAASGKFGQRFSTEMSTIDKVARERVKSVQTQFIKLGRDANGSLRGIAVRPLALDMDNLATRTAIAAQKQQLFNKLVNQGSTNLLNFGKNTQWTGRQLMVGFTIPLGIFGATASKVFMDLEKQTIAFKKVYGDLFTIDSEKDKALKDVEDIAKSMTAYGATIKDTMELAAEAAAAGFQDAQLMAQTEQATRLGILGQVDSQKALKTTIALQSAFQISTEDLADSINFLNAVENQTVLSLDDVTTAIPKVAPVIQQLGGDIKDLAFFLSAMKEGGINASEGANALKSGLASMINPTKQSSEMLAQMGIDINGIVNSNQGDLRSTVVGFAEALDTLDPLNRAKAIEQLFGKFQFARISALFSNVIRDGSQASRVLDLAGTSLEELSSLADSELGIVADATSTKFMAAMENIKFAIAPIGEEFLKLITPILTFGTEVLTAFNNLDAGMRQFVIGTIGVLGGIAPIAIMVFGLLANGVATSIKAFMFLRNLFLKTGGSSQILGQQTEYMTQQQLEAAAVAASLGQTHSQLTQIFTAEAGAVTALAAAYNSATAAQRAFSGPVMGSTLGRGPKVPGFNKGKMAGYNKGIVMVPGSGNKDTEPAMLTPGEAVIPAEMAKKYGSLINAMISGNIPGFNGGLESLGSPLGVNRSHLTTPFSRDSPQFSSGISMAGLESLDKELLQYVSVVSNLVAELPVSLNQKLRKGSASISSFSTGFDSRSGKLESSAKLGGANLQEEGVKDALAQMEGEIRERTISLASATTDQKVSDQILEKATREVIDSHKGLSGASGKAARALDEASRQIGQVRVSVPTSVIRSGVESGEFRQREDGRVFSGGSQIGRVSQNQKTAGKVRPADPFTPSDSYARQAIVGSKLAGEELATKGSKAFSDGVKKSTRQASPSKEAEEAGKNIGAGTLQGLNSQKDEMLAAGTSLGEAAVRGSRRAMQGADGTTQRLVNGVPVLPQGTQSATTVARTSGRRSSAPTQTVGSSVIPPGHFEKIIAGNQAAADSQQKASVAQAAASQNFSSKVMGLSFGITGLAGVMSIFGGEMAQVSSVIFQVSGALTGLMFAFQALPATMTKGITELFSNRAAAFTQARNSTQVVPVGGLGGAGAKGGVAAGAAKAGGALASLGRGVMAFLGGPVGLAITAFLLLAGFAIPALIGIIQEETKKRQALANASDFTTSSLKSLAERVGGTFTGSMLQNASMAGVTDKDKAEAKTLSEDASFLEEFKTQIEGFKNLEGESLTFAIENLTKSLLAGGTSPEAINSILNGLLTASGQSNTQFGMAGISAVQAQGPQNFSSMIAEQEMTISSGRGMVLGNEEEVINTTAMAVNALGAAFATGQVSATGFEQEMEKIKEVIGNIPIEELQKDFILFGGTDAMDGIIDSLDIQDASVKKGIKGLKSYEDQLLVIEALSQGAAIDPEVFDLLASGDPEEQAKGERLLAEAVRDGARAREEATVAEDVAAEATANRLEITAGQEGIDAQIASLMGEAEAYAILTANGFSAADAISLVSDAQFNNALVSAAAAAATDGHSEALDNLLASANSLLVLQQKSPVAVARRASSSSRGGGGGGGGRSGPEASPLDKILEDMARVVSVQTTMTKGFAASRTALDRMFGGSNSSGLFGGLEQQMRALGGGEDLIKLIAGMPPEEFNKRKRELFTFDGAGNISSFRDSLVSIGEALRKIALGEFQSKQQATAKSFNDQMVAINRLVGAGASFADAYEIAGDAALAAAIANETNSAAIRQLVRDTKAAEKATKDFAAAQSVAASNNSFVDQQKLLARLQQNSLRLSNAQIQAVLDDTDLQRLFMDPSIDAKTLQDALNSVASRTALELEIKKLTIDGLESIFEEGFGKAMEAFSAQEKKIEIEFDIKTKPFEDAIRDAEEQISDITNSVGGLDDLEADLERISSQEEDINKKYEERTKALSLIKDLNAQMSQQQKTQLSLADALTQGDIAGAARAAQEMRAQQQTKSLEVQEKALDRARELELGAIVGNMGLTREQLELRIKALKQQIFEIEEQTLEPAQRRVELLDREEQKLLASVMVLGRTKLEWEAIQNRIDIAKTSSDSYTRAIEAALGVVTDIVQYWNELDGKQVNTAHIVTTTYKTVGTPPSGTVPSAPSGGGGGDGGVSGFDPNKAARDAAAAAAAASKAARARVQAALNNRAYAPEVSRRLATMAKATTGTADARARLIESFLSKITSSQADSLLSNLVAKKTPTRTFMYAGGPVLSSMASGGLASMFGSMGTDTVDARLTPGEFVVRRPAVQSFGVDKLKAINNGTYGGESVYNYGININVRSESDPNQIARTVMGTIKSVDAQRIRGNRLG